jgi:cytoskeletal protein RodZ
MDLGTDLRQARERAGFSLPELAARTRIPLKSLLAIEANEFEKVPPGIFLRSFIRTYAREVGVDPTEAIAEFRAMTQPIEEFPPEPEATRPEKGAQSVSILRELFDARSKWGYALIVVALIGGIAVMNRDAGDQASETAANRTAAAPAHTSPVPIEESAPVATAGTGLQIEIRAQNHCWVRAVVDGQPTFARLLQPGEIQSLTAQRDIVLRVGDPAAFSYSINGRTGESLGAPNQPVTVRFASDGHASRVS